MRRALTAVLRLVLRIFFRSVEVQGRERLETAGGLLVVLNHPNGLLDPLLLLGASPRLVSFLAKAPLFRTPLIGPLVRVLGSIPVHRKQDPGSEMEKNRETFERAGECLRSGGLLALFPEGISHDEPRLQPLKTGAARIALGVAASGEPVSVAAVGLTYTEKQTFRSEALVWVGEVFQVKAAGPGDGDAPSTAAVEALTERIRAALESVTLQAQEHRVLRLAATAEAILESEPGAGGGLAARIELRQLVLERWNRLRLERPDDVVPLERRVERLARTLEIAGLDPERLSRTARPLRLLGVPALATLGLSLLLLPLALAGIVTHWPAYRLVGVLSRRIAREEVDIVSTVKVISALVLFPLTWLALGLGVGWVLGPAAGILTGLAAPLAGLAALLFSEQVERAVAAGRAVGLALARRSATARLRAEQDAIRAEMLRLAASATVAA